MKFLSKYFNDEATPDPQVEALPAKRITTDFYRVADLGAGVVVNSRMYAFKQGNGLLSVRTDYADTGIDPIARSVLPDFLAGWFLPKEDKNLTLDQAVSRLQKFVENEIARGNKEHDFTTPEKELSVAQAKKFLVNKP